MMSSFEIRSIVNCMLVLAFMALGVAVGQVGTLAPASCFCTNARPLLCGGPIERAAGHAALPLYFFPLHRPWSSPL